MFKFFFFNNKTRLQMLVLVLFACSPYLRSPTPLLASSALRLLSSFCFCSNSWSRCNFLAAFLLSSAPSSSSRFLSSISICKNSCKEEKKLKQVLLGSPVLLPVCIIPLHQTLKQQLMAHTSCNLAACCTSILHYHLNQNHELRLTRTSSSHNLFPMLNALSDIQQKLFSLGLGFRAFSVM